MTKDMRSRIEELEDRYRLIAGNLVDTIWIVDMEKFTYDFITSSVEKISGYTAEELVGSSLSEWLVPQSYQKLLEVLAEDKKKFKQGVVRKRTMEIEKIHKTGHTYWVEITAKLFNGENGRLKVAGVSKDITNRKQVEKEREALVQELGKAVAEKELLLKENKILQGLLPICAGCKRIRDEQGHWWPLEAYVTAHTKTEFTHTMCDDCRKVYYDDAMKDK